MCSDLKALRRTEVLRLNSYASTPLQGQRSLPSIRWSAISVPGYTGNRSRAAMSGGLTQDLMRVLVNSGWSVGLCHLGGFAGHCSRWPTSRRPTCWRRFGRWAVKQNWLRGPSCFGQLGDIQTQKIIWPLTHHYVTSCKTCLTFSAYPQQ